MATLLTLQNTINWAQTIVKNQPMDVSNLEPGLTNGNFVLSRILGPPFRWRFNRKSFTFPITPAGGTDYIVSVPDLGRIEHYWLVDEAGKITGITGEVSMPPSSTVAKPSLIAPIYDDNQGNITFRVNFKPDQNYTIFADYQAKATLIQSYGQPWGVVPDEFSYIFDMGFLFMAGLLVNDARIPIWEQWFVASLLGAQDGLDEQAMNIFMGEFLRAAATVQRSQGAVTSGIAGRQK